MKILIFNNTLAILAGSETYTLTLATELKHLGHDVTAYSPHLGLIATKLEAIGVKCVSELVGDNKAQARPFNPILEEDEGKFDIAIGAHYDRTKEVREKFPNLPIIAICHGILHGNKETGEIYPEHPVTDTNNIQYVAVSEEIQNFLTLQYGIPSILIRNFFDLEKFKPNDTPIDKIKTIMVSSNYWGVESPINLVIKEVADHYQARFIGIGANFVTTAETSEVMKEADVVFGMGRSVMEGFCMGKIAVVHGRWGTGGVITPESYETLNKTNFSGRKFTEDIRPLTLDELCQPLLDSDRIINQINAALLSTKHQSETQKIVKDNHDVKTAAEQFLDIAKKLIK